MLIQGVAQHPVFGCRHQHLRRRGLDLPVVQQVRNAEGQTFLERPPTTDEQPRGTPNSKRRTPPCAKHSTRAVVLVVGAELRDGGYWLVLFVVLADGRQLDDILASETARAIAGGASPRHVPDDVIAVSALPHTRTGKKLELPVKRLIQGHPLEDVAAPDAVDDFAALSQFARYARAEGT
ncbi:hypothetical protein [Streptomyces sp. NPDC050287]|uniref:AMP-binding enzyme n=1 Tax=Streptomyces sp. NPDC050287 TaxID=3365608 RepID=UPI0037B40033